MKTHASQLSASVEVLKAHSIPDDMTPQEKEQWRPRTAPARHTKDVSDSAAVLPRPEGDEDVKEDQVDCAASDAPAAMRGIFDGVYAAPAGAAVLLSNACLGFLCPQKSEQLPGWNKLQAPLTPGEAPLNGTGKATDQAAVDWFGRTDEFVPEGDKPGYGESWEQLASLARPAKSLGQAMSDMEAANKAGRTEIDWKAQQHALDVVRCVAKHHPELLLLPGQLTIVVNTAAPAINALRSTTTKIAMMLFQEMLRQFGPEMSRELEVIASRLCQRASEKSTAGRENFLTVIEADRTFNVMVVNSSSHQRVATVLVALRSHKSSAVRTIVACHLATLVDTAADALKTTRHAPSSGQLVSAEPNEAWLASVFRVGCEFLEESPPATRAHARRIVVGIAVMVGGHAHLGSMFHTLTPALQRKVAAVLVDAGGAAGESSMSGTTPLPVSLAKPWAKRSVAGKAVVLVPAAHVRSTAADGALDVPAPWPQAARSPSLSAEPSVAVASAPCASAKPEVAAQPCAAATAPALSSEPPSMARASAPRPQRAPAGARASAAGPIRVHLAARLVKGPKSSDFVVHIFALETMASQGALSDLSASCWSDDAPCSRGRRGGGAQQLSQPELPAPPLRCSVRGAGKLPGGICAVSPGVRR